jgi:Skp1 family, tetramerisation domain
MAPKARLPQPKVSRANAFTSPCDRPPATHALSCVSRMAETGASAQEPPVLLVLKSKDGEKFEVDKEVALQIQFVKGMLEGTSGQSLRVFSRAPCRAGETICAALPLRLQFPLSLPALTNFSVNFYDGLLCHDL